MTTLRSFLYQQYLNSNSLIPVLPRRSLGTPTDASAVMAAHRLLSSVMHSSHHIGGLSMGLNVVLQWFTQTSSAMQIKRFELVRNISFINHWSSCQLAVLFAHCTVLRLNFFHHMLILVPLHIFPFSWTVIFLTLCYINLFCLSMYVRVGFSAVGSLC